MSDRSIVAGPQAVDALLEMIADDGETPQGDLPPSEYVQALCNGRGKRLVGVQHRPRGPRPGGAVYRVPLQGAGGEARVCRPGMGVVAESSRAGRGAARADRAALEQVGLDARPGEVQRRGHADGAADGHALGGHR